MTGAAHSEQPEGAGKTQYTTDLAPTPYSEIATPFEMAPPLATGSTIVPVASPLDATADHDATRVPSQTGSIAKQSSGSTARDEKHGSSDEDEKAMARKEADGEAVNVKRAEDEYRQLERRLTELSRRASSAQDHEEKGDDFDLQGFLAGAREEAGFEHKRVGVTWRGLGVSGAGGIKLNIRRFPDAIKEFVLAPMIMTLLTTQVMMRLPKFKNPKAILGNFDGFAKPGEMVLVLGRPDSGCSTFLKLMGNERAGFFNVDGEVRYSGVEATEFKKRYRGEVTYSPESDDHWPSLSVGQTIRFALETKTPAKRLPGETVKEFRESTLRLLLKMLGIDHTINTKVGNAFIRGVSGGERKRVSIAEVMTTRSSVVSWDNSSRGLDASTALDYAKSLRILTDINHTTTFVSLYQAGEGIWEQFDKIVLIDKGKCVYFGPRQEARAYMVGLGFRDLPRQTSADYLTGCTDANERQFQDGRSENDVPSTPEKLEAAYRESAIAKRMIAERDAYEKEMASENRDLEEFQRAVIADRRGRNKQNVYTVPLRTQVIALTKRTILLKLQDRTGLIVQFVTAIVIALIVGSIYFKLPVTAAGAFTRGGVLFIALLFNSFQAFGELPVQMMGRPIMWRQVGYAQYRPAALSLAQTLADIPFTTVQIVLFSIIIYFMSGLYLNAGAFFSFFAFIYAGYLALSAFFRFSGCLCSSYEVAARFSASIIILMTLYSGYIVPVFAQKRWLFWIWYMNPFNYGFAALMENEFGRISLACVGDYITPRNVGAVTKYPNDLGANQVCTLPGAQPGNPEVNGADYIFAGYQYRVDEQWRNFGILILFFVGFMALQALCLEKIAHGKGMPAIAVYAPENKERKRLNAELAEKRAAAKRGEQQDLSTLTSSGKPFTFENLTYDVPVSGGQLRLLNDVSGYVKPGTLTALMGASGAGKTTLLDVLADRKNIGVIDGTRLMGAKPIGIDFQRGCAYAEQQDEHEWTQTVRESLRFSAYLRQPATVSVEEKNAYVEEIIQLLEMDDIADAMIGFPGYGLSIEARKRVTIGVELASKPQLLLFLDEPTTGLDGQSAYNLVRFLRKLAASGQAILCTIHQPNALLFENFDRLILLKRGGKVVYNGAIGKDSAVIRSYFAANGAHCPDDANPAEFMLEAIGAGSQRRIGDRDWADIWADSPEQAKVLEEIKAINAEASQKFANADNDNGPITLYATPFATQLKFVAQRTQRAFWRMITHCVPLTCAADYGFTRLFIHLIIALETALTFLNLGDSYAALQYRVFAIFMATILPAVVIFTVEPMFIMSRNTFVRERNSRMYSEWVFALSQILGEIFYSLLCATAFFLLFYYPIGFNRASNRAVYAWLIIVALEFFAVAVASLAPTILAATYCNPFLLVILSLLCGVTIPVGNMPSFYSSWLYHLDPFTYLIGGLLTNVLHDEIVNCTQAELSVFQPPQGQTCQQWAGEFVQAVGAGYLANPNDMSNCGYCPVRVGDEFTTPLQIFWGDRWRDLGIIFAYTVFNAMVTLLVTRFVNYSRR